jgi:predicted DNA-binding ribbon-helix-helix protein
MPRTYRRDFQSSNNSPRSLHINGRLTSLRLESEFWDALSKIAERRRMTLAKLCAAIEAKRQQGSLASAIRVYVVRYLGRQAHR